MLSSSFLTESFQTELKNEYINDPFYQKVILSLEGDSEPTAPIDSPNSDETQFEILDELLYFKKLLCVPPTLRTRFLKELLYHDSLSGGHLGTYKTHDLLSRYFWWPKMIQSVKFYIKSCDVCSRVKTRRHPPHGLLHPLLIPPRPWPSVSMDHISGLSTISTQSMTHR